MPPYWYSQIQCLDWLKLVSEPYKVQWIYELDMRTRLATILVVKLNMVISFAQILDHLP